MMEEPVGHRMAGGGAEGDCVSPGDGERRPWERDGHSPVLPGEPRLAYQAIVDLATGQLLGFEALLRWLHPTEGVVVPHLVFPHAEATGDGMALGEWAFSEGCRQALEWPSSVQLAVTCSLALLRHGAASRAVRDALADSGLAPDRLTVEVAEAALAEEPSVAEVRAITDLGVQLAVDEVGTSWNSFELLRRYSVTTVKIDEPLVSGLEAGEGMNRMVVETVAQLARRSGMSTVAEGVRTSLHASVVRELEADAAQGHFYAPPLTGERATEVANVPDLRFPLDGPGWQDDDWPVPGIRVDPAELQDRPPAGSGERTVPVVAAPPAELDAIDLVDLALGGPVRLPAPAPAHGTDGQDTGPAAAGAAGAGAARTAEPATPRRKAPRGGGPGS
jgi:EAL domain-containing protein (putative c-di-GMP-specific phosphodiesterase class I)